MSQNPGSATLQSTLLAIIANVSNPPSGLQVGTAAYEDWAVKVAVGYFERAGLAVSETERSDLAIKAEALNMVLSLVAAKAEVGTPMLMDMLKQCEEELRAKRWLT